MTVTINGTTGVSGVAGSAGTPALQGTDTNTGVFYPAADTVAVATNGTEAMRVDSSQNVGIGTSSPAGKLNVSDGTVIGEINPYSAASGCYIGTRSNHAVLFEANASEKMRLTTGGLLGLGTTSPGYKFSIEDSSNFSIHLLKTGSNDGWIRNIGNLDIAAASGGGSGQTISFSIGASYAGLTEAARFDGNRNFLLNKTSTAASSSGVCFQTNDTTQFYRGGDGQALQFFRSSSQVGSISVTGTNTAFNTSSDYRLKHDVQPMTGALARVAALKPCTYKWNLDDSHGEGFIAHELDEVVPGCVTGEKDAVDADGNPVYQGIDTSFLVATLTAAIQEQQALIESLTARITALEAK